MKLALSQVKDMNWQKSFDSSCDLPAEAEASEKVF
jgi:hypothetical protein